VNFDPIIYYILPYRYCISLDQLIIQTMEHTVCVIGAGSSGLAAVKCLLDAGFRVTCYEQGKVVAGRWHSESLNPIPRSTMTNLPRAMSSFSDFPFPDEYSMYLSAGRYCEYFQLYADNFGLYKHIKFQHKVVSIKPSVVVTEDENGDETPTDKWIVEYAKQNGDLETTQFDFVVVSSGYYTQPYVPEHVKSSINSFTGNIIHSQRFREGRDYENQTVLVYGLGNTGGRFINTCLRNKFISSGV